MRLGAGVAAGDRAIDTAIRASFRFDRRRRRQHSLRSSGFYSSWAPRYVFGFEIRVVFELHHFARAPFEKRPADESDPLGWLVFIAVIVLVLHAPRLQR